MRTCFVSLCVVLCLPILLHAQSPAPPSAAPPVPAPTAEAAFSLERLHTKVRFENDGAMRREDTYWVKVLDEQAVRQFGQFPLVYQSETEDLTISEIAVQKPDGTIIPTPASAVQDIAANPGQAPVYLDIRQKVISISALRPGDVLRIAAVWTVKKPIAPGHFWFEYSFHATDIVRDEQLEVDVPGDRAIVLRVVPGTPAEEHNGSGVTVGGRRVFRWKTSHLDASSEPPVVQPGDDEPPSDVRLSSFRDWDDFARWYTPLAFARPDATVQAKADALTAGAADDAAKTAAIYRFVSSEIRYVSLSFGLGRFAAHAPADVLKNQYGDCKDKAVLLGALLGAVGIRAVPVLLNVGRSIEDDLASPLEFNHMIAVVARSAQPGTAGPWMDATMEVAPLGMLGPLTRGKRGLLLDGTGHATVVRTPVDPPFPAVSEINLAGSLNAIGVLSAKGTITLRGDAEILLRSAVRAIPRTSLNELVEAFAKASGIDGELSDAATSDPADTRGPFQVNFSVRRRGTLDWAAERSDLRIPLKLVMEDQRDSRKGLHRIFLGSPFTERMKAVIELPPGYDATSPASVSLSRGGIGYKSTYGTARGQLTLQRELTTTAREVPESGFGEYSALAGAVAADNAQVFKVRGVVGDAPVIPADATTADLYNAADGAWKARRYTAAAALYKRATELDPKMGDAWIGLGLAYNALKKYDDAEAAIRRQIALDQYHKRAYSDLGLVLKDAGKISDAIAAYTKHVELNPLDGQAFKALGELHEDLEQHTEAATALEKASSLLKPDAWVFANLGSAYLGIKNTDKALHAFDRALEIESTPAIWTKIAWHLAEAAVDLDRAENLAGRSEKQIAIDTAALNFESLTSDQLGKMETLTWTWDALGWIRYQRGDVAGAEEYARAAWMLGGLASSASHLGQILQKRDDLADALSFYLTAQALSDDPTLEMIERVKRLAGGGDLKLMLDTARRMASGERLLQLSPKPPSTAPVASADFLVIVDRQRRALDVRFEDGAESVRGTAPALKSTTFPLKVPGELNMRLVVGVKVSCDAQRVCAGFVKYPDRVKLKQ